MKKISIVLALALVLVFAFAVNAMAEQQLNTPFTSSIPGANGTNYVQGQADSYAATGSQTTPNTAYDGGYNQGWVNKDPLDSTTRIHSNYQLNSNACGACHAIHTGVGAYLLQWSDGQATCEACHDGTSKTYDVYGGQIAQTGKMTYGGRFDAHNSTNGSVHNVEGLGTTLSLGAAPGGNRAFTAVTTSDAGQWSKDAQKAKITGDQAMSWGTTFECLSCHDAHGKAGNGRILNPNVNNWSQSHFVATTTDTLSTLYQVTTTDTLTMATKNVNNQWQWMQTDYPYSLTVYNATGDTLKLNVDYTTDNASGFTKIIFNDATVAAGSHAVYYPGVKVNMTVKNYLQANEYVNYVQGIDTFCGACHVDYNTELGTLTVNNTDDNKALYTVADVKDRTGSKDAWKVMVGKGAYSKLTGVYNSAYRHSVGFTGHAEVDAEFGIKFEHRTAYDAKGKATQLDVFNCLSCHVAHGADETVWAGLSAHNDANTGLVPGFSTTASVKGYEGYTGSEVDPRGSFLTRMPNRGVCQTCHNMKEGNEGMAY